MVVDPISAIAALKSAATLAGIAKDIVANMWQYYEAVKKAPERSEELRREISNLACLLDDLDETLQSPPTKSLFTAAAPLDEFEEMLDLLSARVAFPKTKGTGRLKWPFTQAENKRLIDRIGRYKATFTLALEIQSG
jgi:hypothetical protein